MVKVNGGCAANVFTRGANAAGNRRNSATPARNRRKGASLALNVTTDEIASSVNNANPMCCSNSKQCSQLRLNNRRLSQSLNERCIELRILRSEKVQMQQELLNKCEVMAGLRAELELAKNEVQRLCALLSGPLQLSSQLHSSLSAMQQRANDLLVVRQKRQQQRQKRDACRSMSTVDTECDGSESVVHYSVVSDNLYTSGDLNAADGKRRKLHRVLPSVSGCVISHPSIVLPRIPVLQNADDSTTAVSDDDDDDGTGDDIEQMTAHHSLSPMIGDINYDIDYTMEPGIGVSSVISSGAVFSNSLVSATLESNTRRPTTVTSTASSDSALGLGTCFGLFPARSHRSDLQQRLVNATSNIDAHAISEGRDPYGATASQQSPARSGLISSRTVRSQRSTHATGISSGASNSHSQVSSPAGVSPGNAVNVQTPPRASPTKHSSTQLLFKLPREGAQCVSPRGRVTSESPRRSTAEPHLAQGQRSRINETILGGHMPSTEEQCIFSGVDASCSLSTIIPPPSTVGASTADTTVAMDNTVIERRFRRQPLANAAQVFGGLCDNTVAIDNTLTSSAARRVDTTDTALSTAEDQPSVVFDKHRPTFIQSDRRADAATNDVSTLSGSVLSDGDIHEVSVLQRHGVLHRPVVPTFADDSQDPEYFYGEISSASRTGNAPESDQMGDTAGNEASGSTRLCATSVSKSLPSNCGDTKFSDGKESRCPEWMSGIDPLEGPSHKVWRWPATSGRSSGGANMPPYARKRRSKPSGRRGKNEAKTPAIWREAEVRVRRVTVSRGNAGTAVSAENGNRRSEGASRLLRNSPAKRRRSLRSETV